MPGPATATASGSTRSSARWCCRRGSRSCSTRAATAAGPATCAKILNDRNRGCAGWDFHRAHQTQPDGDLSQSLIAYSGAPTGHYYAWLRIALTLPLGTRIYQVTRKSVSGDDAVHMHFKRTFSSTVYVGRRETLGRPLGDLRDEQRREPSCRR